METAIGIMATIISIAALYFTYYQIEMSREHNRKSVKPHLGFQLYFTSSKNIPMGILLKNNGIGPAIIKKYRIILDDGSSAENYNDAMQIFKKKLSPSKSIVTGFITKESIIGVDHKTWLFKIESANKIEKETEILRKFMKSIDIEVEYESMYGNETFKINLKSYLKN